MSTEHDFKNNCDIISKYAYVMSQFFKGNILSFICLTRSLLRVLASEREGPF